MKNLLILMLVVIIYLQGCHDKTIKVPMIKTEEIVTFDNPASDVSVVEMCMEKVDLAAFKNVQRTECYVKEVERLEVILELIVKEMIQKSPSDSRQYLLDAEEAWSYSRYTWCNFVGSLPLAPLPLLNRQYCLAKEARNHIEQLYMLIEKLDALDE